MPVELDVVIPVYNEGENIRRALSALASSVQTKIRVMLCYDHDNDTTLPAVTNGPRYPFEIVWVKNRARGAHDAIMTGFSKSTAPAVVVMMSDDDFNAPIVDGMMVKFREGFDVVCASRFMRGGSMEGCPWLKSFLVQTASFLLHHIARIPVHDATNAFRLFSRRVIEQIPIESTQGFAFSLELLVKANKRGMRVCEVPAQWKERVHGKTRFRVLGWLPAYLRWFFYGFL